MWRSPYVGERMGCDKAQKWILSGAEGVRESPGLPSLNASAGACVFSVSPVLCMDWLLLLGLSMSFAGGSKKMLWVEKALLQLQVPWLWHYGFGFFSQARK